MIPSLLSTAYPSKEPYSGSLATDSSVVEITITTLEEFIVPSLDGISEPTLTKVERKHNLRLNLPSSSSSSSPSTRITSVNVKVDHQNLRMNINTNANTKETADADANVVLSASSCPCGESSLVPADIAYLDTTRPFCHKQLQRWHWQQAQLDLFRQLQNQKQLGLDEAQILRQQQQGQRMEQAQSHTAQTTNTVMMPPETVSSSPDTVNNESPIHGSETNSNTFDCAVPETVSSWSTCCNSNTSPPRIRTSTTRKRNAVATGFNGCNKQRKTKKGARR